MSINDVRPPGDMAIVSAAVAIHTALPVYSETDAVRAAVIALMALRTPDQAMALAGALELCPDPKDTKRFARALVLAGDVWTAMYSAAMAQVVQAGANNNAS